MEGVDALGWITSACEQRCRIMARGNVIVSVTTIQYLFTLSPVPTLTPRGYTLTQVPSEEFEHVSVIELEMVSIGTHAKKIVPNRKYTTTIVTATKTVFEWS